MLVLVPLSQIDDNPFQTRQVYDEIEELAADIAAARATHPDTLGLLQVPRGRLVFRNARTPGGKVLDAEEIAKFAVGGQLHTDTALRVELAFGHRRLRAFGHLHKAAPGYEAGLMPVQLAPLSDDHMLDAVWSENYQRRDISAVEQAELLAAKLARPLSDGKTRSQRDVAEEWNLARPTVANRLRLLDLPAEIQDANRKGQLSERQALALAPVVQLKRLANGREWQDQRYYAPPSPDAYIEKVLANPETTSDLIRQYANSALQYAGSSLPQSIAKFDFDDLGVKLEHMVQGVCKGCPYRINDTCLGTECLGVKKAVYGAEMARAAAVELGYTFADKTNTDDFKSYLAYGALADELWAIHKAGGCPHIVVGWSDDNWGVRPLADGYIGGTHTHAGEVYKDGSRRGVVLGHKGPITATCRQVAAGDDGPEDLAPDGAMRAEWYKQTKKQARQIKAAVMEALQEQWSYALAEPAALGGLMALGGWPKFRDGEDKEDTELVIKKLLDHMHGRGPMVYDSENAFRLYARAVEILDAANIAGRSHLDATIFGTRSGALEARAIRVLYHYWNSRNAIKYRLPEMTMAELEACRQEFEAAGPQADAGMVELSMWLDVATRELREQMAEWAEAAP